MSVPVEHVQESLELQADNEVFLFEVTLRDQSTVLRFRNGPTVTWLENTYENMPCQMTGIAASSDDTENRPTLIVVNPERIFSPYARQGLFELATVQRYTVLQGHLLDNVAIFDTTSWIIGQVTGIMSPRLTFTLKSPLDTPNWQVPPETYSPPRFPFTRFQ